MSLWETHGTYIKAFFVGALFVAACLLAKAWLEQREDRIRLDAELRATRQLIVDREKRIDEINESMRVREKETAALVKKIEELKGSPATIREIVKEIPHYIPAAEPTLTPSDPAKPEAPPQIVFDEKSAQGLRQFYLECQAKTLKLQSCTEDQEDWKRKELTWAEKEKLLEQQRDAALRTVKGGGLWTRFKRNAKWFGIGIAAGVGIAASR